MKVKIISRKRLADDFFKLDAVELQHIKLDGTWSSPMRRLNLNRGEAAGILIYLEDKDIFILVNQFRFACFENGETGWIDEIVAGVFDEQDTPEACAKRECIEEAGYVIKDVYPAGSIYVSPGVTNERIHIFIGKCRSKDKKYSGGGISYEHEDIRIVEYSRLEAYHLLDKGYFTDAKTIIALQNFRINEKALIR